VIDIAASMEAAKLRETWQCRALATSDGVTARVIMAVLFAEYPAVMPVVIKTLEIRDDDLLPALMGYAAISPSGRVICELMDRDRSRKTVVVYDNEERMKWHLRCLADKLKLADAERERMFELVQKWIAADMRYDHEGRKVLH
jgi:hypothetical protein